MKALTPTASPCVHVMPSIFPYRFRHIKRYRTPEEKAQHYVPQRDSARIERVISDVRREIAAQNSGGSESAIRGAKIEGEVFWLSHNMKASRRELVRAVAILLEDIALLDWAREKKSKPPLRHRYTPYLPLRSREDDAPIQA